MNVLKSDIAFRRQATTSLVILECSIFIVEYNNKFFVVVIKEMQPMPIFSFSKDFIMRCCETYLEAILVWRKIHENTLKYVHGVWFHAVLGPTKVDEEPYKTAMDSLIQENKNLTWAGTLGGQGNYLFDSMQI